MNCVMTKTKVTFIAALILGSALIVFLTSHFGGPETGITHHFFKGFLVGLSGSVGLFAIITYCLKLYRKRKQ